MKKRIPKYKYLLSYFLEQTIANTSSEINPHLAITLQNGRLKLTTPNAVYSYEDLYRSFAVAFNTLKVHERDIKNTLILGFGMGSIPIMMKRMFKHNPKYTAIEIDPEIITLAREFYPDFNKKEFEIICMDAYNYVAQAENKFDLIAIDLFIDDTVPKKFESKEFLFKLSGLMNKGALLLFNRMAITSVQLEHTNRFYEEIFKKAFEPAKILTIGGNKMLVYEKSPS